MGQSHWTPDAACIEADSEPDTHLIADVEGQAAISRTGWLLDQSDTRMAYRKPDQYRLPFVSAV